MIKFDKQLIPTDDFRLYDKDAANLIAYEPKSKAGVFILPVSIGTLTDYANERKNFWFNVSYEILDGRKSNHLKILSKMLRKPFIVLNDKDTTESPYKKALKPFLKAKSIGIDIEATDLKLEKSELVTIALSSSETKYTLNIHFSTFPTIREMQISQLMQLLINTKAKLVFHNILFDIPVIIRNYLVNKYPKNQANILPVLTNPMVTDLLLAVKERGHDTMGLAYVMSNSIKYKKIPKLGLKHLVQSLYGAYEEFDFKNNDITKLDKLNLLQLIVYNNFDAEFTNVLFKHSLNNLRKNHKKTFKFYNNLRDTYPTLILTHLVGLHIDYRTLLKSNKQITKTTTKLINRMSNLKEVKQTVKKETKKLVDHKKKRFTFLRHDLFPKAKFNFDSPKQVSKLLFDTLGLPIIKETATGNPATGGQVLKDLKDSVIDKEPKRIIQFIEDLMVNKELKKLHSSFINPAIKRLDIPLFKGRDIRPLFGSFNLTVTITTRLSSSKPNLQNLPTNTKSAKYFKKTLVAPRGYLHVSADYSSLEAKIAAKLSQDPVMLAVYTKGYDSHSLKTFAYFKDQLQDIVKQVKGVKKGSKKHVKIINTIEELYPKLRTKSKPYTFALQYLISIPGLVKTFGLSYEEAEKVYNGFWDLHPVYKQYLKNRLRESFEQNYAKLAFGARLYLNDLYRDYKKGRLDEFKYSKYIKTICNAFFQSYGSLNTRSTNAVFYRIMDVGLLGEILPVYQIHDSSGWYVKENNMEALLFLKKALNKEMLWNNLPELQQDKIPLGGDLELHYPNKAVALKVPDVEDSYDLADWLHKIKADS